MEDTLRAKDIINKFATNSLNPCFNGRYAQSTQEEIDWADYCES